MDKLNTNRTVDGASGTFLRCGVCGRLLPLASFAPSQRPYDLGGRRFGARCRRCHVESVADRPGYVRQCRRDARREAAFCVAWLFGFDVDTYRLPPTAFVHHVDHNEENNAPGNLVVLFPYSGARADTEAMHARLEILQNGTAEEPCEIEAQLHALGVVVFCGDE